MFARFVRRPRPFTGLIVATLLAMLIGLVLPVTPAAAAAILKLKIELAPGVTLPIASGQPFRLRLTYECSSSLAGDECLNLQVTSTLPASLEGLQVLGNTDVQLASYDAGTRTATWQLKSPLPLGTTGQLEFEARFLPGVTVDGTTATVTATVTANGATPTNTSLPGITADAADLSTVTKTLEAGGAAGDVSIYRIDVCPGILGALNLNTVTITDTLPLGATYVLSSPPATSVLTTTPQVVVWSGIPAVNVPNCAAFRVTANFPNADPSNTVGASKTNGVAVTGTPQGGIEKRMTTNVVHTLATPGPGFQLDKSADGDSIIGATVFTNLHVRNTGNVQIANVVVSDPIPNEYNVTSINTGVATSVEYQKNGSATWITGVPTGTNVLVGSFPGWVATDYVSGLRFTLGTVPVAFDGYLGINSTVINPAHNSAVSYTLPHNVTNTATMGGVFNGTPLTDSTSGATTEISVPKARPTPQKVVTAGNPALPGKKVSYQLKMFNGSFRQLDEPVIADLLPAEVDLDPASVVIAKNIAGCVASPAFSATPNFNGSGRTLLQWSWASTGCAIPTGDDATVTLDVIVKAGTYPTSGAGIANRLALVDYSTDPNLVRKNKCDTAPAAEESIFTTGAGTYSSTKLCFSPPSYMRVLAAASIGSAKYVKGQLDSVFHRDPKVGQTVQGGLITYQMELANTGNVDFKNLQMVDVLPYDSPAPGNVGVRDLVPLGTAWTPQLAGPVVISPTIPGLTVRYSTETNPCRPNLAPTNPGCVPMVDGVAPGPGIWSTQLPSDPTTVRSLKFDFGTYVLPANQLLRFSFPMFAPDDAPIAAAGSNGTFGDNDDTNVAWNTFAYEATRVDDNATLVAQPPRVGIEVRPTPASVASYGNYVWNDVNQNGIQDEPAFRGINGVTVRLYTDTDGNPATTNDQSLVGVKITANDVGGNPGYYLFPALTPGNYFAEFVSPTGFLVSPQDQGADNTDSDIDSVTGRTAIVALVAGVNDLTWDAGFYAPVVSLGNRLWYDTNNDRIDNDGAGAALGSSTGITSATVQLFLDANGDGKLTGAEQNWIAQQTTDASGFYLFTAQTHSGGTALGSPVPLFPAQYIVGVPSANFAAGGTLAGYHSSGTTLSNAGVISEVAAPDPDNDADRDDNGDTVRPTLLIPTPFYQGGALSKPVFVDTNEPTGEPESAGSAPGPVAIPDDASNLTLDFGFYTTSFGNVVWNDNGASGGTLANGLRDGSEPGIAGVKVQLFSQDNSTEILVGPDGVLGTADDAAGGVTTDGSGNYRFVVPQGQYRVHVTVPTGYVSTRDTAGTNNPNGNVDNDDNGPGVATGVTTSNALTLTPGAAGTLSNNVVNTAAGSTSDPTVDFGVVHYYSLGNRVWHDTDNSGTLNGSETGISGVQLRLLLSDGVTSARHIDGSSVLNATTNGSGYYRFDDLPAGDYIVEVINNNFIGGGALVGFRTSTGPASAYEPAPDPDNDIDSDDNGTFASGVARSLVVTLGEGSGTVEPTGDSDGGAIAGGEAPDNQSNRTVDFGFYAVFSLGNRVWDDANNNGVFDAGEAGLDGRAVNLYLDSNNDGSPDGAAIASTTTANGGYYLFTGLLADTYIVEVSTPAGYASSTGDFGGYEPAPDADVNAADNDDNGTASGGFVRSAPVTLSFGAEPTGEPATPGIADDARDNNGNYTVDFGFYRPLSLGNLVWEDLDNSGTVNGAEVGISGVTVRLYRDGNGDGVPDDLAAPAGITPADAVRTTTTNGTGHYLFTGLGAGDYIVEVVTPSGMHTSTGQALPPPYEPAPDVDANAADNDDNGTINGGVVRSAPVTLSAGSEPTGEPATPGIADATGDTESNLTVDFGFYTALSLGNLVWEDSNNNGVVDSGEAGINNVTVRLYRDSNDDGTPDDLNGSGSITTADAIATTTTNSSGSYLFTGLNADTYIVEVVTPTGYRTSTGFTGAYEPAPDADADATDNDDNGSTSGAVIRSKPITLTVDGEPTGELATPGIADTTADNRANYTLDFGFYLPLSLGNRVWNDANNNGVIDSGEVGIDGRPVRLYRDSNNDGTPDGAAIASTTTANGGYYLFTGLGADTYIVEVDTPTGFRSSTGNFNAYEPAPDADTVQTDNDDNGTTSGSAVRSAPVTLRAGTEPIGEPATPGVTDDASDNSANYTVDFGFFQPLSLGNLVWEDTDNSGTVNGAEVGINNVTVRLYRDSNNDGNRDDVDGSGSVTSADAIFTTTTNGSGSYLFTGLGADTYIVEVVTPAGYHTSTGQTLPAPYEPAPDADTNAADNDDNGTASGGVVRSLPVTLTVGGEPTGEPATPGIADATGDTESNLTVDFGFYKALSLGNLVWEDADNSGTVNGTEAGLNGVTVRLYRDSNDDGTPDDLNGSGSITTADAIATTTTNGSGSYLFTGLNADTYIVEVVPPAGYRTSTGVANAYEPAPDADADATDNDDNGSTSGAVIRSKPVTLTVGGEPTGEPATPGIADTTADNRANYTVDFGLYTPLRLGNLVWEDANNNGTFDAGDTPLAGAVVSLFKGDGTTPAVDANGAAVANQTTLASGLYLFTNLAPGDYIVKVTAPAGYRSSDDIATSANPNNDTDNDDNGVGTGNAVASGIITLSSHGEPAVGVDGDDTSGNLTADFGFYTPLRLGNFVWEDVGNNGVYDAGTDAPLAGATVSLFKGDGITAARDLTGTLVLNQTTLADGKYLFVGLAPGDYVVKVTAPAGFRSSSDIATSANPNNDTDNDDNGVGTGNAVASGIITLSSHGEPAVGVDGDDTSGNLTADFGFYTPLRLGQLRVGGCGQQRRVRRRDGRAARRRDGKPVQG